MFSAEDARARTNKNIAEAKDLELAKIEGAISSAIAKGQYFCTVTINQPDVVDILCSRGYRLDDLPEDPRDNRSANLYRIKW